MAISDLTALMIDDQKTMRSIVRNLLGTVGIKKVQEAEDISQAIQLLLSAPEKPDFIVTDLHMEKGGGIDFLARLKADPKLSELDIPVVLLTGETNRELLDRAIQAGASQIVGKPCTAQELGRALGKALGARLANRQTTST